MKIELINTGSELLLGRVLNTHQQWICRQLADRGYQVTRQCCISDDGKAIETAMQEALTRSDLIITTGGLGPTSDDITRELVAKLLGKKLTLDEAVLANMQKYFRDRKRLMPASSKVQAMVPEGAVVLPNNHGTAPGLAIPAKANTWVVMLPGPPRELRPMFLESVVPLLEKQFPLAHPFVCRTLKTTGLGESCVEEKIAVPLQALVGQGLEIGYCARIGEVDVRLVGHGSDGGKIVAAAEDIVRGLIGPLIFGLNDDSLEVALVRLLTEKKKTLALAESCTGGFIAHRITNVPGASEVLMSGMVTYSNHAKMDLLGVRESSLKEHGAVSEVVAKEMAEGARRRAKTDYAIAVTGIAGPGGGSEAKPVGTAYVGLSGSEGTQAQRLFNPFDRETFKFVTSQQALDWLRRTILTGQIE